MPPQSNLQKNKLKVLVINQLYKRLKTLVTYQFTIKSIIQFIPLTDFFSRLWEQKINFKANSQMVHPINVP